MKAPAKPHVMGVKAVMSQDNKVAPMLESQNVLAMRGC
jgi:hypothetical protein